MFYQQILTLNMRIVEMGNAITDVAKTDDCIKLQLFPINKLLGQLGSFV